MNYVYSKLSSLNSYFQIYVTIKMYRPGIKVHAWNFSTQEAEVE